MGFNINPPNKKPMIRESASLQDGGAGNLGYFEREEQEENKKQESSASIFESDKTDTFQKEGEENLDIDSDFSFSRFIAKIILALKSFFVR